MGHTVLFNVLSCFLTTVNIYSNTMCNITVLLLTTFVAICGAAKIPVESREDLDERGIHLQRKIREEIIPSPSKLLDEPASFKKEFRDLPRENRPRHHRRFPFIREDKASDDKIVEDEVVEGRSSNVRCPWNEFHVRCIKHNKEGNCVDFRFYCP